MAEQYRTMAHERRVAVLGLGRFGSVIARELARLGYRVLAIDASEKTVRELSADVTRAIRADVTDEAALEQLGLGQCEAAIVAISGSPEASILATVLLTRLGVRKVVVRAAEPLHGEILEQVGARVVSPEREAGIRMARSLAAPGVQDSLDVAPGYGVARFAAPESMVGKSLGELNLRDSHGVTALALSRDGAVTLNPNPSEVVRPVDELIVAGRDEHLERLLARP